MQTVGSRIRWIRKQYLGISAEAFGLQLGVKKSLISLLENDKANISEPVLKNLCKSYNISPAWILIGEGDIFLKTEEALINSLAVSHNLSDQSVDILKAFINAPPETREAIVNFLKLIANE